MNLSAHFTLAEFLRSGAAARKGIDMSPDDSVRANLERLANEVLEPIRKAVGCPLQITSGYRPKILNELIGGAPNSDHMYGRAADVVCPMLELAAFARIARNASATLPVRKLIIEMGEWLHIAIEPLGIIPRREFLVASRENDKTVYKPWEVV